MIREIRIKNFALIDELCLEFNSGFSVFTGETGAGKSILVGAISVLLGERASAEMVRSGYEEAEVSGVIELTAKHPALSLLLESLAIEPVDNTLIIRRKISSRGPNKILVNQVPLPLSALKQLGDQLVDLHGQHEHQSLLSEETHQDVIDDLPGVRMVKNAYDASFESYTAAKAAFESFERRAAALAERKDMLEFQYKEIASLSLKPGEEEELENELAMVSSSTERSQAAEEIISLLGTSDDTIEKRIIRVRKKLETLTKYDPSLAPWLGDITNALTIFTELESFCSSYRERLGSGTDPAHIERINSRLAKIQRLKKKYHCSLSDLIEKQKALKADLASIENGESDRDELGKKTQVALLLCKESGTALSQARSQAAQTFNHAVTLLMKQLGFNGGVWQTTFASLEDPAPGGLEQIRFMVQTNPGEPMLPLAKCASGGEISRLMLAIKTVMSGHDRIPVLIFDEIDTGIGGVLADSVAKALYKLSKSHQVLCISHLHQIASMALHHFVVFKDSHNNRTITRVNKLNENERISEIARMLGGDSAISREHAKELLTKKKVP